MNQRDTIRVRVAEISQLPELMPKLDDRLIELMDGAVAGSVSVYFAAVPLAACIPFDPDYRPDQHPAGASAIAQAAEDWSSGRFWYMIVYPRGKWFIVSDDYVPLFAALSGLPDYVPCWVLGKPDNDLIKDLQGPIETSEVPKVLGIA